MNTTTKKKPAKPSTAKANTPKPPQATAKTPTKSDTLIAMLKAPEGTTIAKMSEKTGWLSHSVRGFLAGTLRKKHGLEVTSEKIEGTRIYRIAAAEPAA